MPLQKGRSHIGDNIKELTLHGTRPRSKKQIKAIALHAALDSDGDDDSPMDKAKRGTSKGAKLKKIRGKRY